MAYDAGLAQIMSDALTDLADVTEKKMFGGICYMWRGNMLAGVHSGGGMARVGKAHHGAALAMEGVAEMAFTGRPMGGIVDLSDDLMADPERLDAVLTLARDFVGGLPAK